MKYNNKWKRTGSGILAVCLMIALLLSNQSFCVYAAEEGAQAQVQESLVQESQVQESLVEESQIQESQGEESQTEENSKADTSAEETQDEEKENSRTIESEEYGEETGADVGENQKQDTIEDKKDDSSNLITKENIASEQSEEILAVESENWTIENGVVLVSGSGVKPSNISLETSENRSQYTGEKQVVFGYKISSNDQVIGNVNITVTDCGIMSDDRSIEIWKITGNECQKINSPLSVSEGKVSFETDGLGEYFAVSDVTSVDLSKNDVTITQDSLKGKQQDGTSVSVDFSDLNTKQYRISQSNADSRCDKNITFDTKENYGQERTIILDGINTLGEIKIPAKSYAVKIKLLLRNVNQVHRIYYGTGSNLVSSANENSRLTIDDYLSHGGYTGELYIPYKMEKSEELAFVLTKNASGGLGPDWSRAGIGGGRDSEEKCCTGLTIAGGKIRVLVQNQNGATAIGGGGNADARLSITGGDITAVCSSTGAAIGGGIGWINRGGNADISISGGTVYAENIGAYTRSGITYGGIAIGSGSSMEEQGNTANIRISGGTVTAYSHYGNGIGSGNSYEKTAANANISISGNSHVTTNALGGGTSQKAMGGSAEIKVLDNAVVNCVKYADIKEKWETETTNVLGAFGIGGGNSAGDAKGGAAVVTVSGGNLNCNGGNIGGGDATGTGDGGDAAISISGGTLDCASIGGGNSVSGMPGSVTSTSKAAGVVVTGGTLKTGTIGGGMNEHGEIGFATADVSGGNIQGQFILANTDTSKNCFFHMTGGTIDNKKLGTDKYLKAQVNGGAVYLSDPRGEVNISGGTIQNATAELGGAVYMTNGSFTLSGDATIQNCTANGNSDNNTTAQGGAVYLDDGIVTMKGGCILSSNATQGGAIYLKNGTVTLSDGTIGKENSANKADEGAGVYVAGGKLIVNGASIAYNKAPNGAGAYLQSGSMEISNGQILHNVSSENGAGAYLAGGTLHVSGGIITENTATENGGGIFLNSGNMTISGGRIYSNSAVNGAGAYLNGGNLTMSSGGDFDSNTASADGGGAYLAGGALTLDSGTFNSNTASGDGGGAYLAGGILTINGGAFDNNEATNGAGAYAADGEVRMFGGNIINNTATQDGGGFYVSSDTKPADIVIRSGIIRGNKAGMLNQTSVQGNGGAIAVVNKNSAANEDHVVIGLRHKHTGLDMATRKFTSFAYNDSIDNNVQHTHAACPTIENNQASGNGGGIYMDSNKSTLDIYCLLESANTAVADESGGSIMSVGGNVNIGDSGDDGQGNNTTDAVGNILIKSRMLVKGGAVNLYGNTENPGFSDQILVDIQKNAGSFADYRFTQMTDAINYKIEYFENFEGSGTFTAIQYEASADIPAMGTMYVHEGYKIIGWAKSASATNTDYTTGEMIGTKDDHSAWNDIENTGALKLYAIWQKISYIVAYHANENTYSGSMQDQSFVYGNETSLAKNAYKVTGKRFLNWNTRADGSGISYAETYKESKMTGTDGATVDLYAQWADCTHKGGKHDGTLSYSLNNTQDTIIEVCDCGGYTAPLKISGADVYYDGASHPAALTGTLLAGNQTVTYSYKATEDGTYSTMPEETTEPTKEGYYQASITVGGVTAFAEYQIKSAASAATIDVVAKKGQHFTDIKGSNTCAVAPDDAFTVQYQVQALNAGSNDTTKKVFVTAPVLTLSKGLPAGTTIIMQTGDNYYWYKDQSGTTEIPLTSFTKMGGTDFFTYDTVSIADTQTYRFIIDFSGVSENTDNLLTIGLKYAYTNPQNNQLESKYDKKEKAGITVQSKAEFNVAVEDNQVTVTAPSDVTDTRWERKNLVWKVTPASSVAFPADAKLTVTTKENGVDKTRIAALNKKREFIVPFDWSERKAFSFILSSEQEAVEGKTYSLTAALYLGSQSQEAAQPIAGEDDRQKASSEVSLTIPVNKAPSLKISGEQKVLSKSDTLKVNITYSNVDAAAYSITGVIRKKDSNGAYNESSDFGRTNIIRSGETSISLASVDSSGSYCLWVTVSKIVAGGTNQTLLEVPYYFIVQ